MTEETVSVVPAEAGRLEEVPEPSTSTEQVDGGDVDTEAKKLMGAGRRNLVMKDIRSAVTAFQEASSILGKKYGETADECADAFFYYGMALLELARMENGVLGNALDGIPEDEEDSEKEEDPNIPSASDLAEKERELLREQVYDAMAEKEKPGQEPEKDGEAKEPTAEVKDENGATEKDEKCSEALDATDEKCTEEKCDKVSEKDEKGAEEKDEKGAEEKDDKGAEEKDKGAENDKVTDENDKGIEKDKKSKEEKDAKTEEKDVEMECDKPSEAPESTSAEKAGETPENKTDKEAEKDAEKTEASSEAVGEVKEAVAAVDESKDSKEQSEEMEADSTQDTEEKPEDKSEDTKDVSEPPAKSEEAAPKEESADDEQEAEGDEAMEGEEEDGADSEGNEGTEEKESEEDDVGNLQLAWEMLDLSKIIFKRQQDKASQLKAAQAHLKLGEVSVESENYSQAVEDFLACLTIQKEHMEEHDRLLAETHYQLALAYQYNGKHEEAVSHFTQSVEVIEKKMAVLTEQLKSTGSPDELQKEMEELKGLLPDIKEKIEDSKEAQKTADVTDKALKETLAGGSSAFPKENGGTSTSAPVEQSPDCTVPVTNCVSDISHLVRKKRKPEESPVKEAKKSKSEPVENGASTGDAVVPTNEEAEKEEQEEKPTPMETAAVESTA